jgi:hypothetical protein
MIVVFKIVSQARRAKKESGSVRKGSKGYEKVKTGWR